jgi:hypothetical protein
MSSTARVNAFADTAALSAYGDARWIDPGASLPGGDDFPSSDIAPAPGSERLINLILPKGADLEAPFWAIFEPALATANGWSDCPETLDASAFARCRALAIASPGVPGRTPAWLSVAVDEVLPLPSLIEHFPPRRIERLETWELGRGDLVRHGDWELMFAPHDDAGHWLLARRVEQDSDLHIVAAGEWVWGVSRSDLAWAGHVVVAPAEWDRICKGLTRRAA